jgi:hypothetical protein
VQDERHPPLGHRRPDRIVRRMTRRTAARRIGGDPDRPQPHLRGARDLIQGQRRIVQRRNRHPDQPGIGLAEGGHGPVVRPRDRIARHKRGLEGRPGAEGGEDDLGLEAQEVERQGSFGAAE